MGLSEGRVMVMWHTQLNRSASGQCQNYPIKNEGCKHNTSHQQACRGDKHDDAVIAHDSADGSESPGNETEVDAAGVYTLPAGADFIMCYSVAQGEF